MADRDLKKAALRGEPSYVWRSGQERRLQMILNSAGEGIVGVFARCVQMGHIGRCGAIDGGGKLPLVCPIRRGVRRLRRVLIGRGRCVQCPFAGRRIVLH